MVADRGRFLSRHGRRGQTTLTLSSCGGSNIWIKLVGRLLESTHSVACSSYSLLYAECSFYCEAFGWTLERILDTLEMSLAAPVAVVTTLVRNNPTPTPVPDPCVNVPRWYDDDSERTAPGMQRMTCARFSAVEMRTMDILPVWLAVPVAVG